ncbi:MAG: hypothetical protein NVS1B4_20210 [Gemmatimonadaceae bacterium]
MRAMGRGTAGDARVAVWEPALAEHGAVIWATRARWVESWAPRFTELCEAIGERGCARLEYVTSLPRDDRPLREALLDALAARRATDMKRGVTTIGPHRDDLDLTLARPGGAPHELRGFGSAGQHRTAAIALRMLEGETLREESGGTPLFLLDDPFAELDGRRSARVLELFAQSGGGLGQVVLAVPREDDIPAGMTGLERWRVQDGDIVPFEDGARHAGSHGAADA